MKIISKSEFYKLPNGTLYSEYQPSFFSELKIKYDTIYNGETPIDYYELDLIGNVQASSSDILVEILDKVEKTGESFDLDFEGIGRNGLYEEDQLYAVYEKKDIQALIKLLNSCTNS